MGEWVGTARAQLGWFPEAWSLDLVFQEDGTYSAQTRGTENESAPAFYYGSDNECHLKRWELSGITGGGVTGEIDITFDYLDSGCGLPGWQGELHHLAFDTSGSFVYFEFMTSDGYEPVLYELVRRCSSAQ